MTTKLEKEWDAVVSASKWGWDHAEHLAALAAMSAGLVVAGNVFCDPSFHIPTAVLATGASFGMSMIGNCRTGEGTIGKTMLAPLVTGAMAGFAGGTIFHNGIQTLEFVPAVLSAVATAISSAKTKDHSFGNLYSISRDALLCGVGGPLPTVAHLAVNATLKRLPGSIRNI